MTSKNILYRVAIAGGTCLLAITALPGATLAKTVEFSALKVLIEINATDGDIGFHVLFDGEAWDKATIRDPNGKLIFKAQAKGPLADQGLTENFFESAEPLCNPEDAESDERVVTLDEFIDRFAEGEYKFRGKTIEGEKLKGRTTLTYNIPAAPEILSFNESQLIWQGGTDLGECEYDEEIFQPDTVGVVTWEAVVEPDIDNPSVLRVQLPGNHMMLTIPPEFTAYLESLPPGTAIKGEVGAVEASGNQTFTELLGFCRAEEGAGFEDCPDED